MRRNRWPFSCVVAVLALHGYGAVADDDDDDDDDGRDDAEGAFCASNLGDVRVRGDLSIAGHCRLTGTEITGDVILFEGGSLIARDVRIRGRLVGSRADFVDVEGSRIDGTVNLQGLVGDESRLEGSDLRANAELAGNRTRFEVLNNELRRSLAVVGNTGGVEISGNSIDRDLECSGNQPPPSGFANAVEGRTEGQCESLRREPEPSEPPASPPPAPPPTQAPPRTPPPEPTPSPPRTPTPAPTPAPPTATPPPAPTPELTPAAPTTPPPTSAAPPTASPPAQDPPLADPSLQDEGGGAGAVGWPAALLLSLLAWWRSRQRPDDANTAREGFKR